MEIASRNEQMRQISLKNDNVEQQGESLGITLKYVFLKTAF